MACGRIDMGNCAKCGKEAGFRDKHREFHPYTFINAIEAGIFPEYSGKEVCLSCQYALLDSKGIKYRGVFGMKQGNARIKELNQSTIDSKLTENIIKPSPFNAMKDAEYSSCLNGLGLLEGEEIKSQYVCRKQTLSARSMFDASQRIEEKKGLLVFTNQNMIFMQQEGSWSSNYSQALRIPLENISGMVIGGTFLKHIRIRVGTGGYPEEQQFTEVFWGKNGMVQVGVVQSEIDMILKEARENQKISKERETVQIILDFSSLKEVMAQGGVVMTTYKCPNCNGMVDIPEAGKVLMCKYCGTPIKPVDIFEKIKSLIQSDVYSKPVPKPQQPSNQVHNKSEIENQQQLNQKSLCRTCSKPINNDESSRNEGICDDCWDNAKMKEDGLS
jgi:hypothetical protein